jgi:hypothetical protein
MSQVNNPVQRIRLIANAVSRIEFLSGHGAVNFRADSRGKTALPETAAPS